MDDIAWELAPLNVQLKRWSIRDNPDLKNLLKGVPYFTTTEGWVPNYMGTEKHFCQAPDWETN